MHRSDAGHAVILAGSGCLAAALLLQPVSPARAQSEEAIEEIVVTGSRLKRRDFSAPSPITTIDSETMAYSGQATLEETLNQMPQVTPDFGRTSNNPGSGKSRIDLRGLGSQRTLVLLNGRRIAPSGSGSAVDVNNLPQTLMQRVEVITGGASTVYGSDAISGVVNFITRDDFDGFGVEASAYMTEMGDSNTYDLNASYGHNLASGRGNFTVFAGYFDRAATFAADREVSSVPYFETWEGEIAEGGSSRTPAGVIVFPQVDFGDGPARTTFDSDGTPREWLFPDDVYNYAPVNYLQIPMSRTYAGAFANYDFNERIEGYVEWMYTRNEVKQNLAPVPADLFAEVNLDNPVLTPEAAQLFADNFDQTRPGIVGFTFRKRLLELGPRIIANDLQYTRIVAGLRGNLRADWEFDAWLTYTTNDERYEGLNDGSRSRLQQGLLVDPVTGQCFDTANGCVALNLFGEGKLSPDAAEFLRLPTLVDTGSRTQKLASALVTGTPVDTWAGPVQTAFGIQWRSDSGSFSADPALFEGDSLGFFAYAPIDGSESVSEVYGEAQIPIAVDTRLAEFLALELGARHSSYKNAGDVNTYKYGGEWIPFDGLRFRTMFQKSVRAPNLEEAFLQQSTNVGSFVNQDTSRDPCSASADPVGNGHADKCVLQGIPRGMLGVYEATPDFPTAFITGGNPELVPEAAETFTVGVVLDIPALPEWQFSVDYFDLEVTDTIGGLSAALVCFDPANVDNLFCGNIRRDPNSYSVSEIFEPSVNRGALKTTGVDTLVHYGTEFRGSDLSVNVVWTHLTENSFQENPVATIYDCAGRFGYPCNDFKSGTTYPNDRVTTNASLVVRNIDIHLTWRWIGGTDNAVPIYADIIGAPPPDLVINRIGSENLVDLGFGYQLSDNVHARLNISNLLDADPPFIADGAWQNNVDTGLYDLFGRSYFLGISLRY